MLTVIWFLVLFVCFSATLLKLAILHIQRSISSLSLFFACSFLFHKDKELIEIQEEDKFWNKKKPVYAEKKS